MAVDALPTSVNYLKCLNYLLGASAALLLHCAQGGSPGTPQNDARPDGQLAACSDGQKNVSETDVDCGGPDCDPCPDGSDCITWSDCQSGVCAQGVCGGAACDDGVRNGNETDVDCGGADCQACPNGSACVDHTDCVSGICTNNRCVGPECNDGMLNGNETDVDCGGPDCAPCPNGSDCNDPEDCESGVCDQGTCLPAGCTDGVMNGNETDIDCGGTDCSPCPAGSDCNDPEDCESLICDQGTCTAPACDDTVQNGNETDIDCGGTDCPACGPGKHCNDGDDCLSGQCTGGVCEAGGLTKTVTINSTDPTARTNFQVPVDLTTANFNYAQSTTDGRDIRFSTDGVQFDISYWIQNWNTSGTSRIWVKVPSVPASGSVDIYLVYGDGGLTDNSNGDNTFLFFDDFEDGTYTNKWIVNGSPSTLTESGGELHLAGNGNWEYLKAQTSFTGPITIQAEVKLDNVSAALVLSDANSHKRYVFRAGTTSTITGTCRDNDVVSSNEFEDSGYPGVPFTMNAWHTITLSGQIDSGTYIRLIDYCNETSCNTTSRTFTSYSGITALVPAFTSWNVGYDFHVRLLFVREYTAYAITATVN